jgi:hypothetical protein
MYLPTPKLDFKVVLTTIELVRILAFPGMLLMFPPFTSAATASGRSINRPALSKPCNTAPARSYSECTWSRARAIPSPKNSLYRSINC